MKKKKSNVLYYVGGAALLALLLLPKSVRDKSLLGQKEYPRGMRNNNPGNLIITSIPWKGKLTRSENTDGKFEQFRTYKDGVRAMIIDIEGDISEGTNTITKLIAEYAPADKGAYVTYVTFGSNIGPFTLLTPDKVTLKKLTQQMALFENAKHSESLTDQDFEAAWALV